MRGNSEKALKLFIRQNNLSLFYYEVAISVTVRCAKDVTQRTTDINYHSRKIYRARNIQIFLPLFSRKVLTNPGLVVLIVNLFPTVIQIAIII